MTDTTSQLAVEGPITGGEHGWPFGRPLFDLADHGYVEEEFFLSRRGDDVPAGAGQRLGPRRALAGRAERLRAVPDAPPRVPAGRSASGSTAPRSCAGTTSPPATSCSAARAPSSSTGYAVVAATVQRVGVTGFPTNSQGLAAWDPERYGSLSIPTDEASYDIFTQVARAVGPGPRPVRRRSARRAGRRSG